MNGDYRKMMAYARDLTWDFIHYNDPLVRLFNTDLDNARGEPKTADEPSKLCAL